jgi:transcription-repair coupling factor (superfamily II helicase)
MINEIKDKESLDLIRSQIEDRFGKIDKNMEIYMYEEWFEKLASKLGIKRIERKENLITIELPQDVSDRIDGEKLFLVTYNIHPRYKLKYQNKKIYISLPNINLEKHFIYYEVKLLDEIVHMIGEE